MGNIQDHKVIVGDMTVYLSHLIQCQHALNFEITGIESGSNMKLSNKGNVRRVCAKYTGTYRRSNTQALADIVLYTMVYFPEFTVNDVIEATLVKYSGKADIVADIESQAKEWRRTSEALAKRMGMR